MNYRRHIAPELSSPAVCAHIDKQVQEIESRFSQMIRSLRVTVTDINGPRGGEDKECCLFFELRSGKQLKFSARASDLYACVDNLVEKAKSRLASVHKQLVGRRRVNDKNERLAASPE